MLQLLCFLGFSYLVIHYYYSRLDTLTNQIRARDATVPIGGARLEAFNNICNECTWIPVFIKVYLIGIFETLYIAICKRGLFNSPTQLENEAKIDTFIQAYVANEPKIAVMTGGDSGIGIEICKGLLLANFHVIIGTRSTSTCEPIIKELKAVTGSDKLTCIQVDLTVFKSVHDFAEQVKKQISNKSIQLLVNNAGVMNIPYKQTEDGYESQCQTNYLSPVLLTQLLLPCIDTKAGRVLFASSSTMYAIRNINTHKPKEAYTLDGLDHYAFSKSCVAHLVQELSKTTPIPVYSYHPGTVRTKLFSHTTVFNLPFVSMLFNFIMLSPKEGARTPLYLCLNKELGPSGTYWANERPQNIPDTLVNGKPGDIKSLWNDTLSKLL